MPADWAIAWIVRDCPVSLVVVHFLEVSVSSWTTWERLLDIVSCLEASAKIPRDCWTDLMKVPEDWARASRVSVWDVDLDAVHSLEGWVRTWTT